MKMPSGSSISWVSPKVVVREAGDKGIGSFVTEPVAKGEILIVQGGRIILSAQLDTKEYEPYAYHCFQVERDMYICPINLVREEADGVFNVNHSCNPTCGFQGQLTLVAMRDLAPGDEVTFDYAMTDVGTREEGWESMVCLCGSENCRTHISGTDWKLPEIQSRYRGYFSPYVQRLIDNQ